MPAKKGQVRGGWPRSTHELQWTKENPKARESQGCPRANSLLDGLALSPPGPVTGREEDRLYVLVREAVCSPPTPTRKGFQAHPLLLVCFAGSTNIAQYRSES